MTTKEKDPFKASENKAEVPAVDNNNEQPLPAMFEGDFAAFDVMLQEDENFGKLGRENIGRKDIVLPFYTLGQNTSRDAKPGKYKSNITGDEVDKLVLTPIEFSDSRVYFPKPYKAGDKAICRSGDGITGRHQDGSIRTCATCPDGQWVSEGGENTCNCPPGYTMFAADAVTLQPFFFNFRGKSVHALKAFISQMAMKPYPPMVYVLEMTPEQVLDTKGKYFINAIKILGPQKPESVKAIKEMYLSVKDILKSKIEEVVSYSADEQVAEQGDGKPMF